MNHHITRRDGRWQVYWWRPSEKWCRFLIGQSPHGIMDAWDKAMDWHGKKAAEAYRKMQEIERET